MVILELIHAKNLDFGRGVFIRLKTNALRGSLVIHNNLTNRMALRRRWFIQISAVSNVTSIRQKDLQTNILLAINFRL